MGIVRVTTVLEVTIMFVIRSAKLGVYCEFNFFSSI